MNPKPVVSRFVRCMLMCSVISTVVGVSFAQFVQSGRQSQPLLAESERVADQRANALEFDACELVLLFHELSTIDFPEYGYAFRAADETAELETVFKVAHLQRGPPRC
jgi:hypothetical protein